ncbi:MAG: hypothetical protein ACLUD2_16825 [Clostridium sp.]
MKGNVIRRTVRRAGCRYQFQSCSVYTGRRLTAELEKGIRYAVWTQGASGWEQYVDLSKFIRSDLDVEILKRTPSAFLGTCSL